MSLSDRLRPDVEAAPWVIKEVKKLEEELDAAWMAIGLVQKENARLREALEKIAINYVIEGDCNSCDFGPSMSSEHSEECTYRIARAALEEK